jgi:hypothetical protein
MVVKKEKDRMHKVEALEKIMERVKPLARAIECAAMRDDLRRRGLNQLAERAEANRLDWLALFDSLEAGMKSQARFQSLLGSGQSMH